MINGLDAPIQVLFATAFIGAGAGLAAVGRLAPLTSLIIVVEMTHHLNVLPALMGAAVIAVFINRLFFQDMLFSINAIVPKRAAHLIRFNVYKD